MNAQDLIRRYNIGERNFRGADLWRANLGRADLRRADLRRADLGRANLRGADLWGADLGRANLRGADLWRADLGRADLRRANLRGADLWGADLRRANLRGADLWRADLRGADLWRADLRGTCLDQTNPPNMIGDFEELEPGWMIGYRTKNSPHGIDTGPYMVGQERWAHQFSNDDTECHPGLFVCSSIEEAKEWGDTVVSVIFRPWELHKAGNKHRVRWFIVWEDIE